MLKAQCCCWAPASTADWSFSFTVYQNTGDIKQILWANLYFWLALMIFAVSYLYVALLHSEHCNAWGHYCIGFTACWFCNLSRVFLEMCLASGWVSPGDRRKKKVVMMNLKFLRKWRGGSCLIRPYLTPSWCSRTFIDLLLQRIDSFAVGNRTRQNNF